jgi:hypothetical protein
MGESNPPLGDLVDQFPLRLFLVKSNFGQKIVNLFVGLAFPGQVGRPSERRKD